MSEKSLRAYWKARVAQYRRARNSTTSTKGITCVCGAELKQNKEPVTAGGWYGDFYFQWQSGRCVTVDALCSRCRVRESYTPSLGVKGDFGSWWIAPSIPALAGTSGPGGADGYETVADALDALQRYAETQGRDYLGDRDITC